MNFRRYSLTVLVLTASLARACLAASSLPPELEAKLREKFTSFSAQHGALFEKLDPTDVRHPYERKVVAEMMKEQNMKDLLPEAERVVKELNDSYHKQHLLNGVLCSETQFPEIYKLAKENAAALQMKPGFKIYVMNSPAINAYTWSIDQDNYGVALFSGIIRSMPISQLRAILGHEMGHVKSKHILTSVLIDMYTKKYNKVPPIFSKTDSLAGDAPAGEPKVRVAGAGMGFGDLPANLAGDITAKLGLTNVAPLQLSATEDANLTRFQQAAEYTGDRAGAVASGDRRDTLLGMVKLASGNVGELGGFEIDAYLKQIETVLSTLSHKQLTDMMSREGSHAFTLMRVGELDEFFKSDDFRAGLDAKSASVFREIMSAEFQIAGVLVDALEAQKKFLSGTTASELNALERRLKEKEFADLIGPRQAADAVLAPMISDTILELGLGKPNAAFDIFESYTRMRMTGVPVKPLTEKLLDRIKFELTNTQLPPEVKVELERKLKVATELKDLKPAAKPAAAAVADKPADKPAAAN